MSRFFPLPSRDTPAVVVQRSSSLTGIIGAALIGAAAFAGGTYWWSQSEVASTVVVRPTPTIRSAVRDIARLEVTEVHVEKVVDLSDRQKTLFGLVDTQDAMLLVAAGSAVLTVDLDDLDDGDIRFDKDKKTVRLRLAQPKVSGARLDPDATYVYRRDTSVLAKRNEQLEGRARKEAVAAIEGAAGTPEMMQRARAQAERQITKLLAPAGVERVIVEWGPGASS